MICINLNFQEPKVISFGGFHGLLAQGEEVEIFGKGRKGDMQTMPKQVDINIELYLKILRLYS